jgi:hypothetical protein
VAQVFVPNTEAMNKALRDPNFNFMRRIEGIDGSNLSFIEGTARFLPSSLWQRPQRDGL